MTKYLTQLFREQVTAHPSSIAVDDGSIPGTSKKVTYQELDELSDNLSIHLRQHGVRPRDVIPVLSTRCIGAIVALLAIHKLRACYVPIDLDTWGSDRIEGTLNHVKATLVVTTDPNILTGSENRRVVRIPGDGKLPTSTPTPPDSPQDEDPSESIPEDWAYVIFTSGSTGKPKGVIVSQRSISALVTEKNELPFNLHSGPDSRVLLIFSFAFDACTYVIFGAICNGATLVLASPSTLEDVAQTCHTWIVTPSILGAMDASRSYDRTSLIMMGGEHPTPFLVDSWAAPDRGRRLINIYGPTEATCTVLMHEMRPGEPIAMGHPISFCDVRLTTADGSEITAPDGEGEMLLGGPGVAVGYHSDPARTAAAFVVRPDGRRFYRTGDYARRTPQGLVFCGRRDAVVKNRGFLVNLETEVEPALLRAAAGKAHAVAAVKTANALVAFVAPAGVVDGLRERMLRAHTTSAFLVPDVVRGMDVLPLTPNGKIDRKALAALHEEAMLPQFLTPEVFLRGVRDAGRVLTPLEAVRHAVCMVLRVVQARVEDDNASFRALGGHSLAAVMLVATVRKLGFRIDVASVLTLDTVSAIAAAATAIVEHDDADRDAQNDIRENEEEERRYVKELGSVADGLETVAPATDMQVRMVRGTVDDPTLNFIKIGLTFDHGEAEFLQTLRSAWRRLSARHSILRSSFHLQSTEPLQLIHAKSETPWLEVAVDSEKGWTAGSEAAGRIDPNEFTAFDERDSNALSRVAVVVLPGVKCRFIWTVHHSLVDGWSASVVMNDLWELLHDRSSPPCPQFVDAAWCVRWLIQRNSESAKEFWKAQLGDIEEVPRLRIPPPADGTAKGLSERRRKFSIRLSAVETAAKECGVTPAALVYGAWALVLSRYCDSQRVVLGAVLSGRSLPLEAVDKVVGPLINSLPLSVLIQQRTPIPDFLRQVFKSMCQLLEFQWTPNHLIQEATGKKGTDYFDSLLAIQFDFPAHQWPDPKFAAPYDISIAETTETPLSIMVDAVDGYLDARFVFRPSNFGEPMVERMMNHFENILHLLIDLSVQPSAASGSVGEVTNRMLSEAEMHFALNCTEYINEPYEGPETLADAFEISLSRHADYLAVEGLDRNLTYRELDSETARITTILLQRGVKPGDIICIIADGSVNWLLAVMSVVRTGAAYCPIDHKFPSERQSYMMSLCRPAVVLYPSASLRQPHPGHEGSLQLDVETILGDAGSESDGSSSDRWEVVPKSQAAPNDLAVILFTSGTTGFPKAVQLEHKPILSVLSWEPTRLRSKPGQRNAQLLSLGFDCCVTEVFSSLLYGATLVLKDPADPLAHLSKVDAIVATPSLVMNLDPSHYPNLKVVTLMGEPLPAPLARRWMTGRILQNSYGPAETTLMTNAHPLSLDSPISVGKPIPRVVFYILDSMGRPVPTGVSGEIFVASSLQVSRGYRNNPEETLYRFLEDPFRPGWKMFRSGDMGRWNEEGNTEIIGRTDSQIKLRGFRIDLGDIEATIARLAPDIDNVAVVVTGGALRAFVTPETVNTRALMETLRAHLPEYSTPSNITALDGLPLSPNGKVNRKELGKMHVQRDTTLEPLNTDTEFAVAAAWADLLSRDQSTSPIGALDRFFDLGGHSLLQIRLAQKLSTLWNTRVPLRTIIRHQVLRELCTALDEHLASAQDASVHYRTPFAAMDRVLRAEKIPASYLEREMVLNQMLADGSPVWNIVYTCTAYGTVDLDALAEAFQQTITKHEVLRSRYHNEDGHIMRSLTAGSQYLSRTSCRENEVDSFVTSKIQQLLDPFDGNSLIQLHVATVTPWKSVFVFVMSHIIGDGPTLYRVLRETSTAYTRLTSGSSITAHSHSNANEQHEKLSYLDWAQWSSDDTKSTPTIDKETRHFWQTALSARRPALPRPTGTQAATATGKSAPASYFRGTLSTWTIRPQLRRRLARLASLRGLSMHQIALTATWLALRAVRNRDAASLSSSSSSSSKPQSVIALGAPMTLRMEPGTEDMPGLLLDRLVVPLPWGDDQERECSGDLSALLETVRERSEAARGRFVPHCVLRRLLREGKGEGEGDAMPAEPSLVSPIVEVVVSFHTAFEAEQRKRGFRLVHGGGDGGGATSSLAFGAEIVEELRYSRPQGVAKFPVMIEFTDEGDGGPDAVLRVEMEWDEGMVEKCVAERLEAAVAGALEMLGAFNADHEEGGARGPSVMDVVDALRGRVPRSPVTDGTRETRRQEKSSALIGGNVPSTERAERVILIREVMAECLGLERVDVGCMRSFWELGAESMDAVRLQDACAKKGLQLDLRDIFISDPTADLLAGACEDSG